MKDILTTVAILFTMVVLTTSQITLIKTIATAIILVMAAIGVYVLIDEIKYQVHKTSRAGL